MGVSSRRIFVYLLTFQFWSLSESSDTFYRKEVFATKTPYLWTRQTISNNEDLSSLQYNGQTCPVVYVDGLYRHGARYPTIKWVNRMNNLKTLLSAINGTDQFVKDWVNVFTAEKEATLSNVGEEEMNVLGRRIGTRFETFLNNQSEKIKFYSSTKSRAVDSATNFQRGLRTRLGFNSTTSLHQDNRMLRFYDDCELWEETTDADDAKEEHDKFVEGSEIAGVVSAVNNRVLGGYFNLTFDEVEIIQQICAIELGFFNTSDWCDYLSLSDLEVMDYANDIEANIEDGYVFPITARMTCPLLSAIFKQMDDVISEKADRPLATFRFGHSGTLFPVYAALSLYNETRTLLASDYLANTNRQLRTSKILPFSANIVFSLYKCGNEYMVKLMVNEEEAVIPACGTSVCAYRTVRERYSDYVDCDFNNICENDDDTSRGSSVVSGWLCVVVTFMAVLSMLLL